MTAAVVLPAASLPLPDFAQLTLDTLKADVQQALSHATGILAKAEQTASADAASLIAELDLAENQLQQIWGVLSNLNATRNTPELRELYNQLLPELSRYYTEQGQNQHLYQHYLSLHDAADFTGRPVAEQSAITLALRDFRLSGVALEGEAKQRFAAISERLSQLSSQFSDHLLDATQAFVLALDAAQLSGLPASSVALLQQLGQQRGLEQPAATLDAPAYMAIQTYADDRALRETLYHAYVTRASELGTPAHDNSDLMAEILQLRQEKAALLGFASYADLSLASKMADDVEQVIQFLQDLAAQARQPALDDLAQLEAEAATLGYDQLQPWDSAYLSEKIKQREYNLSQESLKPYFPAPVVIDGLFKIAERLYGIQIQQKATSVWHEQVSYYEILEQDRVIGGFYFDLYARSDKRGGAWMSGYRSRVTRSDGEQAPVAFMVGNFAPPVGDQPAQLTHQELITLFHEFGHGLHHLLTEVGVLSVAGIHGVAWDAVELPSQFMEFWTWEPEALALISQHVDTAEVLPKDQLDALLSARFFQSGLQTLRQVEFALFDLEIHRANPALDADGVQASIDAVRAQVAVSTPPDYNRFQHGFSHIFAGGYAAGYYSYKWAEVLASDAFDRFEQEGIFNTDTGKAFRQQILAVGGSRPAQDSFAAFRGRAPSITALLRHNGWSAQPTATAVQANPVGTTA
ncbi:MAG: M3 family metallopeptidase [Moraxellaceae bacterium]